MPVLLPPGRARLSASPMLTGSVTPMKTMGTVDVVFFAATAALEVTATRTSTFRRTSSAACSGSRFRSRLSWRYSIWMLCPST